MAKEMTAGREMDVLIAEHVLKWRKMHGPKADYDGPCESYDVLIPPGVSDPFPFYPSRGSIKPWFFCRKWSTDIANAWEVVERMPIPFKLEKCWEKAYQIGPEGWSACWCTDADCEGCNENSRCTNGDDAWAETAPLAICRAALKAMGVRIDG